jgi:hypothetical protein
MANTKEHTIKETVSEHKVAVGMGLAAVVAAAAGAYYLYGNEKGAARRRKLKSWMLRMKADVLEQIELLKEVNEEAYQNIIEGISEKYRQLKDADPAEVAALAARMKMHWRDIQKDINEVTSGNSRTVRSTPARNGAEMKTRKAKTVRARKVSKKKA